MVSSYFLEKTEFCTEGEEESKESGLNPFI